MKPVPKNLMRLFSIVTMALSLEGCSSPSPYILPPNGQVPEGMGVVFGDVSGASNVLGWLAIGSLSVINTPTGTTLLEHHIEARGCPFYWCLPPGKYAILDLKATLGSRTTYYRIYAEFSVDSEQDILYVGTLDLTSLPPTIVDDFDAAAEKLRANYPTLRSAPLKRLLQLEKPR
jgi:hypothetical protein